MEHLTLIIPAKYEKESLPSVLSELKKYNLKIIVVLEKEDLDTINSIKEYDCKILYQINKGYGEALLQGIRNVKTNFFCFFNADGSFNPNELKNMYNLVIKRNADFIFGSRYMSGALSQDDTIITLIDFKSKYLIYGQNKFIYTLYIYNIAYYFINLANKFYIKF